MTEPARHTIFLSHSGLDHALATRLAQDVEREVALLTGRPSVEVFNTSEPEHRFRAEPPEAGPAGSEQVAQYEERLREYLRTNLLNADVYLLLVTPRSLRANSKWIAFEMATADGVGSSRDFFFPCAARGASLDQLPGAARRYQGVDLGPHPFLGPRPGFHELTRAICLSLSRGGRASAIKDLRAGDG